MRARPAKLRPPSEVPCQTVDIRNNIAVKTQRGGCRQTISITRIAPFFSKEKQE